MKITLVVTSITVTGQEEKAILTTLPGFVPKVDVTVSLENNTPIQFFKKNGSVTMDLVSN